jgi:N6-adenosine-specific RNA methylase IME4
VKGRKQIDRVAEARDHAPMSASPRSKHYRVIYADPPWTFSTYSRKGKGRSPEAYYDCMSLAEIKTLPVAGWAADDCVLLLWATDPLLDKAFEIINAWGFTYKTVGFYWTKLNRPDTSRPDTSFDERSFFTGLGFWTRANPELCLLATRGRPHRRRADVRKLIVSPRREHSRKPEEAYERIEWLCEGPYLEMFARFPRPGWDSWGISTELPGIRQRRWRANSYPNAPQASGE